MKKGLNLVAVIITAFILGLLTQRFWPGDSLKTISSEKSGKKIRYWVAPMDPTYRRDKPGKSPMGMDLVPVYDDNQTEDDGSVKISANVVNNLGVKTAVVKSMDLARIIDTVGYVTVDENKIEHIHTYADGWIKTLNVKTTGELVKPGQLLLELYSPTLNNAQEELLLAVKNKNNALIKAGEKKLLTLGMAKSQIQQLRKTRKISERVKIYATQGGIVSKLNVREGKFIKPDTDIMTIQDLSTIWIIAEVFERQAEWVKEGQATIATLPYIPGKVWEGNVDYVYPELDAKTHTLRVRLAFPNPDLTIKPNMYADIKISSKMVHAAIAIPRSAVIRTGRGDRVILALGDGRFRAQGVKLGIESGEYYQILSGLTVGQRIVTSAQFLIDSESSIQAAFSRMDTKKDMSREPQGKQESQPQEFVGMGQIKAIDKSKRMLTFHHQPISALNMPAMVMTLLVEQQVDISRLNEGDRIHFVLRKQAKKQYKVIKINKMKSSPQL